MALDKKVISTLENTKEQTIQEQMATIVEVLAQQAATANKVLEEVRSKAEFEDCRIAEREPNLERNSKRSQRSFQLKNGGE